MALEQVDLLMYLEIIADSSFLFNLSALNHRNDLRTRNMRAVGSNPTRATNGFELAQLKRLGFLLIEFGLR